MQTDYAHISLILDRSGSMHAIQDDTIGAFNRFLADQQAVPGKATLTLVQFDHEYQPLLRMTPLAGAQPLTTETFVPRGNTALLDAIGRCIVETGQDLAALPEAERPAKVLCVILTDGLENASREFSYARIHEMITHQREKYGWEFVFLGANQDAILTANWMGIGGHAALTYQATSKGIGQAVASLSDATIQYRSGSRNTLSFTDQDRQRQAGGV